MLRRRLFARSGSNGGQNVNKENTKVHLVVPKKRIKTKLIRDSKERREVTKNIRNCDIINASGL